MKIHFFTIATVIVLCLSACGGGNSNKNDANSHENGTTNRPDTHVHADGTVHEGATHSDSEKPMPVQESFKVETDSTTVKADTIKHNQAHDDHDGHDHNH
ncbi:MAG: hypothetical protein LBE79_04180 [Tannerella sp.]|nr:hypothetical protein [Tannerella sp.]